MPDREWPQPFHSLRDQPLHDPAEMQTADHAVDRQIGKQLVHLGADIDDPGMRAGAEDDQSQILDMGHEHALVEQQRIGLPRRIRTGATQMVDAALFKGADPRDFAAVIKVIVEQQPRRRVVDNRRTQRFHFGRRRHIGGRDDRTAAEPYRALVEHPGVDMNRGSSAVLADRMQCRREGTHVVPMTMAHRDALDFAQRQAEIGAISDKDSALGAGIEQHRMMHIAAGRYQPAAKAEIGA